MGVPDSRTERSVRPKKTAGRYCQSIDGPRQSLGRVVRQRSAARVAMSRPVTQESIAPAAPQDAPVDTPTEPPTGESGSERLAPSHPPRRPEALAAKAERFPAPIEVDNLSEFRLA